MKDINTLNGRLSPLLAAKNEIDPLVKMATDVRTFKGISVLGYEDLGISFGPRRQLDIINASAITLSHSEIVSIAVSEKLWKVEKFRNEFSNVRHVVPRRRLPSFLDRIEQPVRVIKAASLEEQI
jgi:hypothetical protein